MTGASGIDCNPVPTAGNRCLLCSTKGTNYTCAGGTECPKLKEITCQAGQYLAANGTNCTNCPIGSYCTGGKYTLGNSSEQGRQSCTNKPNNSSYTGTATTNNCAWSCNNGYGQTYDSKCIKTCTAGINKLHAGSNVTVQLYDTKHTTPSIAIQKDGKTCYGNLTTNSSKNALNVQYNGQTYHTVN